MNKNYKLFFNDLPDDISFLKGSIAIDTEAMGLNIKRDRLCLVQMCDENSNVVLVKYNTNCDYKSPNLVKLLEDENRLKIFHFARFDVAIMKHYLKIKSINNIFCTKIASKLARTYTDRHGLKTLVSEICHVVMDKEQQTSNWGIDELSSEQIQYAISDVIYLHRMLDHLSKMLKTLNRYDLAIECFNTINLIADLDIQDFGLRLFEHL